MLYARVVAAYQALEATTSRRRLTDVLIDLLRDTPRDVLPMLVYLTQGQLAPTFEGIELGLAERMAVRAVALASGQPDAVVAAEVASNGDAGTAAERLLAGARREPSLTVAEVSDGLLAIARATGPGTVGRKVGGLEAMLRRAAPAEARYLVRTATGRLRLGVSDMTLLDALAVAFAGSRAARPAIARP